MLLTRKKRSDLKPMSDKMFNDICEYALQTQTLLNIHPRMFVAGGFAIYLYSLQHKDVKKTEEKLKTKDIDFTVYIKDESEIKVVMEKLYSFLQHFGETYGYDDFAIKEHRFRKEIVQNKYRNISNVKWVGISYKKFEFMDIMFSKIENYRNYKNTNISKSTGFPLRSIKFYIEDISILYVKETLKGVDDFAYKKRNPFEGEFKLKGQKNFSRLKFLCSLVKDDDTYCSLVRKLKQAKEQDMDVLLNMYVNIRKKYDLKNKRLKQKD
mgnify:CR=1 FL=1